MATDRAGYLGRNVQTLFEAGSYAGVSDGQLLERFHDSGEDVSQSAFAALVERHGPMVLRICRRILRNDERRSRCLSGDLSGLAPQEPVALGPRVAGSVAASCRLPGGAAGTDGAGSPANRRTRPRRSRWQSGCVLPSTELLAVLHEELDRLPDHYRAAIVLCDLEGYTCEQTARYLGCPIGTVGSRLVRGREKLRGRLIRRGLAPAVGTIAAAFAQDAALGAIPTPLVENTARAAMQYSAHPATGIVSFAAARIARDLSRSLLMTKLQSIAAVGLAARWSHPGLRAVLPGRRGPATPYLRLTGR